jgi:hypothetical protein
MSTSTTAPRVRDLFKIPEQIGKMDFTVVLADGIDRPRETVDTYVITPQLLQAFDQALGLVGAAHTKRSSQAAYLHGSFGSGKSHFMAMLSLLLADHEGAWSRPELHGLRIKYPWIGQAKVLELHVHMLDQPDVQTPIFAAYLKYVRARHPEADLPGIFADEALFEDAERLLSVLGDTKFFGPMNALAGPAPAMDAVTAKLGGGWSKVEGKPNKARRAWDRARFEAARGSVEPEVRAELLTALTKTHLKAFGAGLSSFVEIDRGLGILSRHAKSLGYDVIVLLLDELILWLSYMGRTPERLGAQVQRLVKLVEATDNDRPAPFCSFIARQRPLREMVGDALAGPDDAHLAEVLDHARGRFGEIQLGDDNLPAIVAKRVLLPRDEGAVAALRSTFERLRSESQQKGSWTTLLGTNHDADAFRQVYPFSPVLVDALVALSNALQRQRTAIRLLTELLIRHIEDLQLGQLVGVGDLFDVMAEGEKATEGPMGARFDAARRLYKHDLLPLIQAANQTDSREKCQRLRPEHPPDVGCANCPQVACRNDNRAIKTLLIAALVPGVAALREMTVRRVVDLNHGWLTAKIPGRETTTLIGKLRKWASEVAAIRLGDQAGDPQVAIQLEGVDVRPLLAQAREVDTPQRRRRVLFELLLAAMEEGGELAQGDLQRREEWRGTKRPGALRFDNVRQLGPDRLRCAEEHDWRIVIDYPFDEGSFGPHDDERVIREFMAEGTGSWTLVWLPSFFSEASNKTLGELVRLGHILSSRATTELFVGHLSVEQQEQAKVTLQNLESQKKQHLLGVLAKAYGLAQGSGEDDPDLDPARMVEQHLYLLKPGVTLQAPAEGGLSVALKAYTHALLDARYPRHPRFSEPLTTMRSERLLERFAAIVEAPDHKITLDRRELEELRGTLGELGLVRVTDTTAHLRTDGTLETIERRRRQRGVEDPRVDEVLRWADEQEQMGLQAEAAAVLVRAYALAESRALMLGGEPFDLGRTKGRGIPGEVVLELPDLPEQGEWGAALAAVGHLFGVTLPRRARTGENTRGLARTVEEKLKGQGTAAQRLPRAIEGWREALGIEEASARLTTATAASELVARLSGRAPADVARALASFGAEVAGSSTSLAAIGRALATAKECVAVLDDPLVLGVFRQLTGLRGQAEAEAVLGAVATGLRQDELQKGLAGSLRELAREAQEVMARLRASRETPAVVRPPEPAPVVEEARVEARAEPPAGAGVLVRAERRAQGREAVNAAIAGLEATLAELRAKVSAGEDLELTVRIELWGRTR